MHEKWPPKMTPDLTPVFQKNTKFLYSAISGFGGFLKFTKSLFQKMIRFVQIKVRAPFQRGHFKSETVSKSESLFWNLHKSVKNRFFDMKFSKNREIPSFSKGFWKWGLQILGRFFQFYAVNFENQKCIVGRMCRLAPPYATFRKLKKKFKKFFFQKLVQGVDLEVGAGFRTHFRPSPIPLLPDGLHHSMLPSRDCEGADKKW